MAERGEPAEPARTGDEQIPDPELPEGEVTVWGKATGASTILVILVTIALVPFVQAIASSFGTKLADALDGATRRAVGRLLHRLYDRPEREHPPEPTRGVRIGRPGRVEVRVVLTEPDSGAEVELHPELPAEALAQLVRMTFDRSVVGGRTIYWQPAGDPAGRWHVLPPSYGGAQTVWDDRSGRWLPAG